MKSELIKRVITVSGYILIFLVTFMISAVKNLDITDMVGDFLKERTKPYGMGLSIEDINMTLPVGIELKNILLIGKPQTWIGDNFPNGLKIDNLEVDLSLLRLLFGKIMLNNSFKFLDGLGNFTIAISGNNFDSSGVVKDIKLDDMIPLKKKFGIKVKSRLSLKWSLQGDYAKASSINGWLKLMLSDTGSEKLDAFGYHIPPLTIDRVVVDCNIKKGVVRVQKVRSKSKDFDVDLKGDVRLMVPPSRSVLKLTLLFKPTESLRRKMRNISGLLNLAGLRPSSKHRGMYGYYLFGSLSRIGVRPIR